LEVTLDRSLKGQGRLARARSVLSRDERIAKMREEDRWQDGRSPFGLPKIRVAKAAAKKKAKKEEAAEGDAAAAAPAAGAAAPDAKAAAAKPAAKGAPGKK
jgi:small basic protein (TIGR04137 family)